jgi:hypothetical protein
LKEESAVITQWKKYRCHFIVYITPATEAIACTIKKLAPELQYLVVKFKGLKEETNKKAGLTPVYNNEFLQEEPMLLEKEPIFSVQQNIIAKGFAEALGRGIFSELCKLPTEERESASKIAADYTIRVFQGYSRILFFPPPSPNVSPSSSPTNDYLPPDNPYSESRNDNVVSTNLSNFFPFKN